MGRLEFLLRFWKSCWEVFFSDCSDRCSTNCQIRPMPNTESAMHNALGKERERGVAPQGGRKGSGETAGPAATGAPPATSLSHHKTAEMAGSSETPSHSPSSTPLSRSTSGAKMRKVTCLMYQVSHRLLLLPFCVISGGCELFACLLSAHLPSSQISASARESESLTWTWAQNIQDVNLPILVQKIRPLQTQQLNNKKYKIQRS